MAEGGTAVEGNEPMVVSEFQDWFQANSEEPDGMIFLYENQIVKGRIVLDLAFANDQTFQVSVPKGYPSGKWNGTFQIQSTDKSLQKWSKAMQEYATKEQGRIKLAALLKKAVELHRLKDTNAARSISPGDEGVYLCDEEEGAGGGAVDDDGDMEVDGGDSDELLNGSSDEEEEEQEDDGFTTTWDIQMDLKKKRWRIKEKELRAKWDEERLKISSAQRGAGLRSMLDDAGASSYDEGSCEARKRIRRDTAKEMHERGRSGPIKEGEQIFAHDTAAFQILCNELVEMLRSGQDDGLLVSAIEDSVYSWAVTVRGFEPNCKLYTQLQELKEICGYDHIELQLDFVPDFPFYPPILRVVRPRFTGSMVQSLANVDLLNLTYWNPTKTVHQVLMQIKQMLEQHAEVDIGSDRNNVEKYPEGAYHPIEDHLIKLALATETRPRANSVLLKIENLEKAPLLKAPPTKKSAGGGRGSSKFAVVLDDDEHPPSGPGPGAGRGRGISSFHHHMFAAGPGTGWAKGTGYGSSRHTSEHLQHWNPDTYAKAQLEKDKQVLRILNDIDSDLMQIRDLQSMDERELYYVLDGSAVIPFLESELSQQSLIEIARHLHKFRSVLNLVEALGRSETLLPLLCNLPRQRRCIMALLEPLADTATNYLRYLANEEGASSSAAASSTPPPKMPKAGKKSKFASMNVHVMSQFEQLYGAVHATVAPTNRKHNQADEDPEKEIAMKIVDLFAELRQGLEKLGLQYSTEEQNEETVVQKSSNKAGVASSSSSSNEERQLEEEYKRRLKPLQFADCTLELRPGAAWAHDFAATATGSSTPIRAVYKEWTALRASLPLNLASSVLVRYDEQKTNVMSALIMGPEGTPYANGCFLFDIFFPRNYPYAPPKVHIKTTGGGTVRFNPNLYNCGKVCLSLLGTWAGDKAETWNKDTSTLLQVLVSIQSLIMIDDPYFNEPGYENSRGTDTGKERSDAYNMEVRKNCLRWAILEQLKNPPPAFADAIKIHFELKRDIITKQLSEWQSKDSRLKGDVESVNKWMKQLFGKK